MHQVTAGSEVGSERAHRSIVLLIAASMVTATSRLWIVAVAVCYWLSNVAALNSTTVNNILQDILQLVS
jgi:hypothetical protein